MINIINKEECCGCEACVQVCPKSCISFNEDSEGFKYPLVNLELCIHCDLCEKVCPVINQYDARMPLKVYAVKNNNKEVWQKSSSGGVFTPIAEKTIKDGGIVFGAAFDDKWAVNHIAAENINDLCKLQKSKYVQSHIGDTYIEAKEYLNKGLPVLFSGTHCQIAGLHRFLRKKYDNLTTIDVLCHGVPSPLIWRDYLNHVSKGEKIDKIEFRKKVGKTQKYLSVISNGEELCGERWCSNSYIMGFLNDIYLRPSCYVCPSRKGKSCADLTLADYWGIEKVAPDFAGDLEGGISLILTYSDKGEKMFKELNLENIETKYDDAIIENPALERSTIQDLKYKRTFWKLYKRKGIKSIEILNKKIKKSKKNGFLKKVKISIKYRLSLLLKTLNIK